MAGLIHHHPHRVLYAECTLGDHVYHARYLDILEEARGEFMRSQGFSFLELQSQGLAFPILECRLQYRQIARYDDLLNVETCLAQAGRLRLTFSYRITNQAGRDILEGETHHAATTLDGRPTRLPKPLLASLAALVETPRSEVGPGACPCPG